MSIIGPRPHMLSDCTRFSFVIPHYHFRNLMKPGITGWAQVKGHHGPTRDYESIINRYNCDVEYIRHANIWMDIEISGLTVAQNLTIFFRTCSDLFLKNNSSSIHSR